MEKTEIPVSRAKSSGSLNGKPIWIIETPIETHDGKIFFYDQNLQCYFDIRLHQTKGEGAYYYDKVKEPSDDHVEILKMLQHLKPQKRIWMNQELFNQLKLYRSLLNKKKEIKIGPFMARMSELRRKNVLIKKTEDTYKINHEYIAKILDTGKYETNKKKVPKILDPDELFRKMVAHYLDLPGYDKDRANKIAQKVVNDQLIKHGQKPVF